MLDFAVHGLVALAPESLGIPAAIHERVYTEGKAVHYTSARLRMSIGPILRQ